MKRRDVALDKLRSLLADGGYPPGARLPPERDLCGMLGISRSGLREAFEVLESEGAVWRHVGKGTYVGARPIETSRDLATIRAMTNPADIMEVRLLVEPGIARMAALRASESEIAEMRRCVQKLVQATEAEVLERWDSKLHATIAHCVRNKLLMALFDAFNAARDETAWGQLGRKALTASRRQIYTRQHAAIVEAIAAHDADAAEHAMREHLETLRANLLSAVPAGA